MDGQPMNGESLKIAANPERGDGVFVQGGDIDHQLSKEARHHGWSQLPGN